MAVSPSVSKSALPQPLQQVIQKVIRRRRWQLGLRLTLRALMTGLGLTLLLILLGRFYPLSYPLVLLALGLAVTGLILTLTILYVFVRPFPAQIIAQQLDRQLKLDERLSTALELARQKSNSRHKTPANIIEAQLQDTIGHLEGFNPVRAFPIGVSWRQLSLIALLSLTILLGLVAPNPQLQLLQQQAQIEAAIAKETAQLEQVRADLLANEALLETPTGQEALQTLDDLLESLQNNRLSPEEALAALSDAEQGLADLQNEADLEELTLNDLAKTFNQFDSTASLAEAIQERDLAQAAEFLNSAADNLDSTPDAAQAEFAEALEQAAQAAQETGDEELAEALSEAAEALQQNIEAQQGNGAPNSEQAQAAQEALQQAAEALAEGQEQLGNQQALEEALGNIQEAREQLAQAAGEGETGEEPGQGQGSGQGQGELAESGENSGAAPGGLLPDGSGAGRGEAGEGSPDLFADRPSDEMDFDNGPNESRLGEYDPRYPPIHWGGDGGPMVNPDPQGAEGGLPIGNAPVNPNQPARPAQVPYNQVYGQYADAAGEALEDTYVPLGLKEYVRNYFGALEPGQ